MILYDGLNNLSWFIGIIEKVGDPTNAGRVKVRAFGFHPTLEENTVSTQDLPWAFVLSTSPHMYVPLDVGEMVFGAFLDGRDAQQPLVFGVIPTPKFAVPVTVGGGGADSGQVGSSALAANYPTGGNITQQEAYDVALQAGFSEPEARTMAAIAVAESGLNSSAYNPNAKTGDNSYGLWQINMIGALGPERRNLFGITSNEELLNPLINARAAYAIYKQQGFNAWTTYKNGLHEKFLDNIPAIAPNVLPPTNPYLKTSYEVIDNFGNKALPPQATGEDLHRTPAAPAMTNARSYSSADTTITHPGIPVGGSYKTGVWNARYDGSYIEMHAGSNREEEHINVVHRSGSHITLDQNGNITISSTGKVHISSANDLEQNIEGYSTNVSKSGYAILVDGGGLSLTSTGDINIRSNANINLGAGGNIFMTSGGAVDIDSAKIGLTAGKGIISLIAGQNIAIQSNGDISAKAKNMAINTSAKLGIAATGDLHVKAANMVLASAGDLHQKGNGVVLEGSTMGIKSAGYATIDAGGFANIVGTQIHLNDGGSVDSVEDPDVISVSDTGGAVRPEGPVGSPPPMGVGTSSKQRSPTPGGIAITDTDDIV